MNVSLTTNARQIADRQRRRAAQVHDAARRAARVYGAALKSQAVTLSRGPGLPPVPKGYRSVGPYSIRLPARMPFDAMIGQKSGRFAASWRLSVSSSGGVSTMTLDNSSPEAAFMGGTRFMRRRPVLAEAVRRAGSPGPRFIAAIRAAEKTT